MPAESTQDAALAQRVLNLVRTYVDGRTAVRSKIDPSKVPFVTDSQGAKQRRYPPEWFEARAKVAQEAFLQMRSHKSREDFVAYLTGTLCAHGLESGRAGYFELADRVIMRADDWEDVRSLAMLAVSTMAYVRPSNADTETR